MKLIALSGVVLGTTLLLYPFIQQAYSTRTAHLLHERAQANLRVIHNKTSDHTLNTTTTIYKSGLYPDAAPTIANHPKTGEVIGTLSIPSIGIQEAILEGTDQPELAKAPGHLKDSVLPGQIGTSIVAAHNVTTFRHIDKLATGTLFTIETEQGVFTFSIMDQKILRVGEELPETAYPAVALETCYPLDAWDLTDQRMFVIGALVESRLR